MFLDPIFEGFILSTVHMKIAEGFGLKAKRVEKPDELGPTLRECFGDPEQTFTDLVMQPEDKLVPPVPNWVKRAKQIGIRQIALWAIK